MQLPQLLDSIDEQLSFLAQQPAFRKTWKPSETDEVTFWFANDEVPVDPAGHRPEIKESKKGVCEFDPLLADLRSIVRIVLRALAEDPDPNERALDALQEVDSLSGIRYLKEWGHERSRVQFEIRYLPTDQAKIVTQYLVMIVDSLDKDWAYYFELNVHGDEATWELGKSTMKDYKILKPVDEDQVTMMGMKRYLRWSCGTMQLSHQINFIRHTDGADVSISKGFQTTFH